MLNNTAELIHIRWLHVISPQ